MQHRHRKKIPILILAFFIFLSSSTVGQESPPTEQPLLLTFKVQSWKTEDVIEIKYPTSVSTQKIRDAFQKLAHAHSWDCPEHCFEIVYQEGDKVGRQCGNISEKERLNTTLTLNFEAIRTQFSDFKTVIINIEAHNGLRYQGNFYTPDTDLNADGLPEQNWQDQFQFQKTGIGMYNYQIRYTFHTTHTPEFQSLPVLRASISFSNTWFLKAVPLLILQVFLPNATLYLFLRQGVSLNKKGKIRLSFVKTTIINKQFLIIPWLLTAIGCADVMAMLTHSRILGFILGVCPGSILSFIIFVFLLHKHEKNMRQTTWTFRENFLTNLRMILLGTPALLLPICFLATRTVFPHLSSQFFLWLLLAEYAILTVLFACVMPFVMSWIWKGKPLEDSSLSNRLHQLAEEAEIDYRNIAILQTRSHKLANAWVAGIVPQWRSVFVTDYLLDHLRSDEIAAIFAHELGHVKHRHLLKQVAYIVLGFGGHLLLARLNIFFLDFFPGIPQWLYWLLLMGVHSGVMVFFVQFSLMRFWHRMEFEADAYAVDLTGEPAVFLQALRKLIQLNDAPEDLDTFNEMLSTHPNFKARTAAIEQMSDGRGFAHSEW